MTNLAKAIQLDPEFGDKIDRIVVMGGCFKGDGFKNIEFNFLSDVEALNIVLDHFQNTSAKIELVTKELSMI